MEEKEEIKRLKKLIKLRKNKRGEIKFDTCICCTADLETVLNLLEKKDKIIDLMSEEFSKGTEFYYSEFDYMNKEDIKQYFEKEVNETNE